MARVIPFAALRPHPDYARSVAAPPYDVLSTDEARLLAADNPYSFLHVDKAEMDIPGIASNDPAIYVKACENINSLLESDAFTRDTKPCLYIYRLTVRGRSQTGLAACVDVDACELGQIKKHELTRKDKEQDRIDHITACNAHTGPIFMTYRAKPETRALMRGWTQSSAPVYDFTADDGVRHTLWVVDDDTAIAALTGAFETVPCLYIADGHHRSAAAAAVAKRLRDEKPEAASFLAVLFPHDELTILDYNRVVRDLNGYTPESLLVALSADFEVEKCVSPVKPDKTQVFGLYMAGEWHRLTLKTPLSTDAVEGLAVSVLQTKVLSPILGINDPQTDKRIDFVGGIRGTDGLVKRVDSGEMSVAFTLCPTTLPELMAVADAGRIMPPKSTWFEPKLRSGLLIHRF